jgi:hypothetical protein
LLKVLDEMTVATASEHQQHSDDVAWASSLARCHVTDEPACYANVKLQIVKFPNAKTKNVKLPNAKTNLRVKAMQCDFASRCFSLGCDRQWSATVIDVGACVAMDAPLPSRCYFHL